MRNYNDLLAQNLNAYPNSLSNLGSLESNNLINMSAFNQLQKQRVLQALQQAYMRSGRPLSPIQRFGLASSESLAQGDQNIPPDQY